MTNLEISFRWTPIQGLANIPYCFPQPVSKYLRREYRRPAVYRWVIEQGGKTSIYIGETEDLARRLTHYLNPGIKQPTNTRIRGILDLPCRSNARISFDMLEFDPFSINQRCYSMLDLGTKETRCFLENLSVTLLPSEVEKLNRVLSVPEKAIARAVKTLNPSLPPNEINVMAAGLLKALADPSRSNSH